MPAPNEEIFFEAAQEFYLLWDIPHCVGAIDVRHIRIKQPNDSKALYFNYKKFYSTPLQAVANARYRFLSIDVGGFGRHHDSSTFRYSSLYRALKSKRIRLPAKDELYDSRTICSYFFIGDGAYPLSKNLLKPHPGAGLEWWKKIFNRRLSRARQTVEWSSLPKMENLL